MRRGRPKAPLTLTDDERETLERWVRRPTTAQALAQRARIVLACVSGRDNSSRPGTRRAPLPTDGLQHARDLGAARSLRAARQPGARCCGRLASAAKGTRGEARRC